MTRETFNRYMTAMADTWPSREVSKGTLDVYWLVLQNLHDSVFEVAVAECLKTCKFFPVPAEIIAKAEAVLNAAGALPPETEDAWAQLLAACKEYHPDLGWVGVHPKFPDLGRIGNMPSPLPPLLGQAVQALGGIDRLWNAWNSGDRDLGFIRREFSEFYEHRRERELRYGPDLLGQALPAPNKPLELKGEAA